MLAWTTRVRRRANGDNTMVMRFAERRGFQPSFLQITFCMCFCCCLGVALATMLLALELFLGSSGEDPVKTTTRGGDTSYQEVATWTGVGGGGNERWVMTSRATSLPCPGFQEQPSPAAYYCANGAASRAPLSSLRNKSLLDPVKRQTKTHVGATPAQCYAPNGVPVARPLWATSLLQLLLSDGAYDAVTSLLHQNRWYLLIGWVSDRFMPPQKPGRRANGDPMFSQTRGKNASYYLETYGSMWHAKVEVGKWRFHFQLVHRNAIAVCVRERIHLYKYYCLSDSNVDALPIHVCACRHCVIPTDDSQHKIPTTFYGRLPLRKESLLVEISKLAPSHLFLGNRAPHTPLHEEEDACIDAFSAPWLINTSVVASFPYEGRHNDLDGLLKIQSDQSGFVTVVVFNIFWRDHLHNFVYSFTRKAKMRNLIVATTDDAALSLCLSFRLPCLNAHIFAEPDNEEKTVGNATSRRRGFTRKVTEEFSWVKPRLAIAILRRGYTFMLADLDITWNRSPMPYLQLSDLDFLHQCDNKSPLSINSGLYMVRPNERILRYFQDTMSFRTDESSDQNAMRLFMKYDHIHGVSHRCLPRWEFNMKCNYKVERSRRLENGLETFLWNPYPVNETPKWVAMHATCLSGAKDKIRYFKTIKAWFLDELDAKTGTTSSPKFFCVLLPPSLDATAPTKRILHGVVGTTTHSDAYKEMTPNPAYLRKRH
ncbi:hypothetical protein TraAM80_04254 [Trypanosoma rangeli]|uniref:Nucleotide-diphospho-sugar transferase domain-containing protein n=1 Tax=Trypanosoma rangeli TaxID=5698 RepID=A0A3R7NFQ2_TRYRA|nr:uncharacterized protein TraAM80_04254 [Trypanosoma rangeli]RNF05875.1 hypothetical protein TraAM80_04254 [Trypanosoma rangeli]|eukprot:RNF05875.1 hypothetical protein TraAM80_04254 [Trypanosoma rangeli]